MSNKFVRSVKNVRDVNKLSPNTTTENDLISTLDGKVYINTLKGYQRITPGDNESEKDLTEIEQDLKRVKESNDQNSSEITNLKTLITNNETDVKNLTTKTDGYNKTIEDLESNLNSFKSDVANAKQLSENNNNKIINLKSTVDAIPDNSLKLNELETKVNTVTTSIDNVKGTLDNNTTEVSKLKTTISQLQTQITDLSKSIKRSTILFEGSKQNAGTIIQLSDDLYKYDKLYISGTTPGGTFNETVIVKTINLNKGNIVIQRSNLRDSDGVFLGVYELLLTPKQNNTLEITNDVSWDEQGLTGSGKGRNAWLIQYIEGVK